MGTVNAWDGAYADFIVMPERHLFHLPENVSFDNGAMIEPAATALYAVRKAAVTSGDSVLVHGTGPIGIMAAKFSKLCGAAKVFITGRKEFKLNLALQFGADTAINTLSEPISNTMQNLVGAGGIDKVIEASGSHDLFNKSLTFIKPGGIVSCVAFYEKAVERFDLDHCVLNNISILGVGGSLGMYQPVLKLMSAGIVDFTPLITARYTLRDAPQALRDMGKHDQKRIKIMLER